MTLDNKHCASERCLPDCLHVSLAKRKNLFNHEALLAQVPLSLDWGKKSFTSVAFRVAVRRHGNSSMRLKRECSLVNAALADLLRPAQEQIHSVKKVGRCVPLLGVKVSAEGVSRKVKGGEALKSTKKTA